MEFIYILSCQRGAQNPEIYSIWNSYEGAIKAYYQYFEDTNSYSLHFLYLYEFPINEYFCENTSWSKIKLSKSCKYRLKFKSFAEFKNIYIEIIRNDNIKILLD